MNLGFKTGYEAWQLDRMHEDTVGRLITVKSQEKKAANKERLPGVLATEEVATIPMTECLAGWDNATDVLYPLRYKFRPARVPPAKWWHLTEVKGWTPALGEHMRYELGRETLACIFL